MNAIESLSTFALVLPFLLLILAIALFVFIGMPIIKAQQRLLDAATDFLRAAAEEKRRPRFAPHVTPQNPDSRYMPKT